MERPAQFGLVLRMTCEISELIVAVSELAFVAIFTGAVLFEGTTKLGLVTR